MVLVLEHATSQPRGAVIAEIQAMVRRADEDFRLLASRIPELGSTLALSPSGRTALTSYVQAMRDQVGGCYDWQSMELRAMPHSQREQRHPEGTILDPESSILRIPSCS